MMFQQTKVNVPVNAGTAGFGRKLETEGQTMSSPDSSLFADQFGHGFNI